MDDASRVEGRAVLDGLAAALPMPPALTRRPEVETVGTSAGAAA